MRTFGASARFVRRIATVLGIVAGSVALVGVVPAGGGEEPPEVPTTTFVVNKVVVGAGSPTQIVFTCSPVEGDGDDGEQVILGFDGLGHPTTASEPGFEIVGESWVGVTIVPDERFECVFLEAPNTALDVDWTCDFQFDAGTTVEDLGCSASAGTGLVGPGVLVGSQFDEIESQVVTVTFTNTFAAVVTPPIFTDGPTGTAPLTTAPTFAG
jgi:hypothetical protein